MRNLAISNPLFVSLVLLVVLIGNVLLSISNTVSVLNIMFIVLAHLLVIYSLFNNGVQQRDWLNPINIILLIGMVRFSLPLLLLQFGSPSIEMFQKMNIGQGENWRHANILALVGLLGVAAGWNITIRPWRKACPHRRELPKSVAYLAVTGMLAGAIFLSVFIESNSTLEEAILTGSFRGTDIQAGTGKYFHLGLMLISCSVILSSYLIKRGNVSYMVALLPVLIATIFYFILGGRTRAITPLIAGLLVIWYERENSTFTAKNTFVLFILFLGLLMFYSGSVLYRARLGLEGFAHGLSFIGLVQYLSTAIWMEIGQLHALAGSLLVGPGVLGGLTFTKLLWPISEFLNIPGNSTGIYLAETLVGFNNDKKWGMHATLIGDAYVNFGLAGLISVTVIFGALLKCLYTSYKERKVDSAIYVLMLIYFIRIFYESIEKYSEFLTITAYAVGVFFLSKLLGSLIKKS